MVLELSAEGVDVTREGDEDQTPLYIACEHGHLDVVNAMLSTEGVDPNQAKKDGWTPLYACFNGHLDVK